MAQICLCCQIHARRPKDTEIYVRGALCLPLSSVTGMCPCANEVLALPSAASGHTGSLTRCKCEEGTEHTQAKTDLLETQGNGRDLKMQENPRPEKGWLEELSDKVPFLLSV